MSGIAVSGWGAVSPAGWGVAALRDAIAKGELLERTLLERPGRKPLPVLRVPPPNPRPSFLAHARLRRASPITQYAISAALEALGPEPGNTSTLGIVVCVFSGCVNYSRRFYGEILNDPATASPLVFSETVFNAPASHLSAFLGSRAINYTLVGDSGTFLIGLATAAQWLSEGKVDRCLVVGTEELDWLTADAVRLFDRTKVVGEGAGALLLESAPAEPAVALEAVSDEHLYTVSSPRGALENVRFQLQPSPSALLCDSTSGETGISRTEFRFWREWPGPRISPRQVTGEALMAAAAWQCVLAVDGLQHGISSEAIVSVAGFHQHAIGATFARSLGANS